MGGTQPRHKWGPKPMGYIRRGLTSWHLSEAWSPIYPSLPRTWAEQGDRSEEGRADEGEQEPLSRSTGCSPHLTATQRQEEMLSYPDLMPGTVLGALHITSGQDTIEGTRGG